MDEASWAREACAITYLDAAILIVSRSVAKWITAQELVGIMFVDEGWRWTLESQAMTLWSTTLGIVHSSDTLSRRAIERLRRALEHMTGWAHMAVAPGLSFTTGCVVDRQALPISAPNLACVRNQNCPVGAMVPAALAVLSATCAEGRRIA